jgi:glycosyltransferase involved in cell wall biosynthesis
MRIGMLLDNDFKSDPRVYNEAGALCKAGHEVHILCFSYGTLPAEDHLNGIYIHRFLIKKKLKDALFILMNFLPLYTWLWYYIGSRAVKKFNLEAIHAHDLYMVQAGWLIKRKFNLPLTIDLHENFPAAIKAYKWTRKFPHRLFVQVAKWEKKEENLLSKGDSIIVLSQSYGEYLKRKCVNLAHTNFVIYPNVPDVEYLEKFEVDKPIEGLGSGFWLFYFGVISERRGIFTAMDALKNELSEIKDIKLLLVGPVDKEELKRFNQYLGSELLKDRILHFAWKDISDLPALINASSVCISPIRKNPQHDSGIANKVFQYMLFARPLIVSNCSPQEALINEAQCGLVFESGDSADFAKMTLELYKNADKCTRMGASGRTAILGKYNLNYFAKNLNSCYNQ